MKKQFLGSTELEVSTFGFGTYRADARVKTHQEALDYALKHGINVIDTSSNYRNGYSEKLVGEVLSDNLKEGSLKRDKYVIISKGGYIQGEQLERLKNNKENTYEHVLKLSDQHWHCFSRKFIEEQVEKSLKNMGLDYVDVYLLHNPEYFFKVQKDKDLFYSIIEETFSGLEKMVDQGKIKYYGVSSNVFGEFDTTVNLDLLWKAAEKVKENHHFRVIQMPLNLIEAEAVLERDSMTTTEKAEMYGLGVLSNRPLNAFSKDSTLLRLADFKRNAKPEALEKELEDKVQELVQWEKEFKNIPVDTKIQPFFLGHILFAEKENIQDIHHWQEVYRFQIHPLLENSIKQLAAIDELRTWLQEHIKQSMYLIELYSDYLQHQASEKSLSLSHWLDEQDPENFKGQSLSQKVLNIYASLQGIHCTLVGMREKKYVEDVLDSSSTLKHDQAMAILENFNQFLAKADKI